MLLSEIIRASGEKPITKLALFYTNARFLSRRKTF